MSKFLFAIVLLALCTVGYTQNVYLSPGLISKLNDYKTPQSEMISVDVVFNQQLDYQELANYFEDNSIAIKDRPNHVMRKLKEKASLSKVQFEDLLLGKSSDYSIKKYYWLVNMVVIEAKPSLINILAEQGFIQMVSLSTENYMKPIKPIEAGIDAGKSVGGIEPGIVAINVPALWAMGYTGRGRIAFTLDTGIWPQHPTFRDQFLGNHFGMNRGWLGFDSQTPKDKSGTHGTHVTGTILGLDPATHDTIGIAHNAYFMVSDPVATSLSNVKPISAFVDAFEWAFNPDGDTNTTDDIPDVINNSWGYDVATDTSLCVSFVSQMLDALELAGIAAVFSAGNEGPGDSTISTPHHINTGLVNSFTVGSISPHDTTYPISSFSSRGPSICPASGSLAIKPEVVAPGYQIRSSVDKDDYDVYNGTSMASPHVTGTILLLKEAFPNVAGKDILLALYYTARDLGATGEDNTYGMGMIDALAAFNYLAQTHTPTPPASMAYDISIKNIVNPSFTFTCDSIITPEVSIVNLGDSSISGINIYCQINGNQAIQSFQNIVLQPGQITNIALQPITMPGFGNMEMVISAFPVQNISESDRINNYKSTRFNVRPIKSLPIFEDFEGGSLVEKGWFSLNPDDEITWDTAWTSGLWGSKSAKMQCYGYAPKASQLDDLLSPYFEVNTGLNLKMIFDYAYQFKLSSLADTLKAYMVYDCDVDNKVLLWKLGGEQLETFDSVSSNFVPKMPNHWKTDTIEISNITKSGMMMIDFQSVNRLGNNIYLDNIKIFTGNTAPQAINTISDGDIAVFPNPTSSTINVSYNAQNINCQEIIIIDAVGKVVKLLDDFDSNSGKVKIDISNLEKGIYFLVFNSQHKSMNFKVVKN